MNTLELREEIHKYINHADDRVLKLIFGMLQADAEDSDLTDEHKKIIDQRILNYKNNPSDVLTWDEVKANISK